MNTPFKSHEYDLVIFGGGCAGLSLLVRLAESGWAKGKRIALIEKDKEKSNDRTWCFWEKAPGYFEQLVYRKWDQLAFFGLGHHAQFSISPYLYKMIRGGDFYRYCMRVINDHPEIEVIHGDVSGIQKKDDQLSFNLDELPQLLRCSRVFSSLVPEEKTGKNIMLLQHFKGWVVRTENAVFNSSTATFMDFRIPQDRGTSFVYVLPFSDREALVEYTLFSRSLLEGQAYDEGLKNYLTYFLHAENYEITAEEFGIIPMTNRKFPAYSDGIYYIGTAGGQTKASSGYTFRFIQEQSDRIVQDILSGKEPSRQTQAHSRFRFYDNTLLYILYHNKLPGQEIFSQLFRKNDPKKILAFLDNKTSLLQEVGILTSLPMGPFLKAALRL